MVDLDLDDLTFGHKVFNFRFLPTKLQTNKIVSIIIFTNSKLPVDEDISVFFFTL